MQPLKNRDKIYIDGHLFLSGDAKVFLEGWTQEPEKGLVVEDIIRVGGFVVVECFFNNQGLIESNGPFRYEPFLTFPYKMQLGDIFIQGGVSSLTDIIYRIDKKFQGDI